MAQHPFDTPEGHSRLTAFLADPDPQNVSYAISSINAAPFVSADVQRKLFDLADQHADRALRLESAWAQAKVGLEQGKLALLESTLLPQWSAKAVAYLDELGHADLVPQAARAPDFAAMAEMCQWLAHPNEFGEPPDNVAVYDTRTLYWPPTNDRRTLWLVRYQYDSSPTREGLDVGVGIVGGLTTFALFDEEIARLSPEDLYGLYCSFELEINNDPRAPKERDAASGRVILAEANPGFPP